MDYFSKFPNLKTQNWEKYLISSVVSAMGHLDQQYQDSRSTSKSQDLSTKILNNLQEDLEAFTNEEKITLPLSPSERTHLMCVAI